MKRHSVLTGLLLTLLLVGSCATNNVPASTIYLPSQAGRVVPFYVNGVPIGAVASDSTFMMVSLDFVTVGGAGYMRLWLLYENDGRTPLLLEPLSAVTLAVVSPSDSCDGIVPESPTQLAKRISNEKAKSMILQAIGGALEALSVQPTKITSPSGEEILRVGDTDEKVARVQDRTDARMRNTATYYDVFKRSVTTGILRRNTVFPGQSVNGYIYFPLHTIWWGELRCPLPELVRGRQEYRSIKMDAIHSKFLLDIRGSIATERVEFMPAEGE